MSPKELGTYLKELRLKKELTTREVYDLCGVSNSYLSLVENGQRKASAIVLKKLAPVYGVNYLELYEKAGYADLIENNEEPELNIGLSRDEEGLLTDEDRNEIKRFAQYVVNKRKEGK